jgi:hypothetical protein
VRTPAALLEKPRATGEVARIPNETVARLGFWSGAACAATSVAFFLGVAANATIVPANRWIADLRLYAASYNPAAMLVTVVPSILIVPSFLGLVVAVHSSVSDGRRAFTLLAVVLAAVYAAILVTNYYLQLSFVRANVLTGNAADVASLLMENPRGVFWPIESLAYGIQGIALGLAAAAFAAGGLERWIRLSFIVVALSGVLSLAAGIRGVELTDPAFIIGGTAWGIGFPMSAVLSAVFFWRNGLRRRIGDNSIRLSLFVPRS